MARAVGSSGLTSGGTPHTQSPAAVQLPPPLVYCWYGPATNLHSLGLTGIYPPELDIPQQAHSHLPEGQLPFLDILLVHSSRNGRSWYDTRLYDKRDQPAFREVRLSRFVHASSCVNEAAKRNIFITDVNDFVTSIANLMHTLISQQYSRRRLDLRVPGNCSSGPSCFLCNGVRVSISCPGFGNAYLTFSNPLPPLSTRRGGVCAPALRGTEGASDGPVPR